MSNYREYQQIIRLNVGPIPGLRSNSSPVSDRSKPNTEDSSVQKSRKKITRTKTGCFCCRRRKKKCDEKKPVCSGCLRNMLHCVYPTEEEMQMSSRRRRRRTEKATSRHIGSQKSCSIGSLLNDNGTQTHEHGSSCDSCEDDSHLSSASSPGSPYSTCSSNGTNDYITPVSSPELKAYSLSPVSDKDTSSLSLKTPSTISHYTPPKGAKNLISVKSLLN
ncbi:DEKNAAC104945 [Brettanomyces naardenensis]|uniref:DEKNAAC104945 n=1 Tax=Brettanomyces naardenensis TaxID=13370 RepID=A0A448YSC7_BRENA|nr:DEKNAAC104945 [Brettanomyces naardenensis]